MVFETNYCGSSPLFRIGIFWSPTAYKSPQFSKTLKIILAIAVIIYTSYLVFASLEIAKQLYGRMGELQNIVK